jgi:hypothetical protein
MVTLCYGVVIDVKKANMVTLCYGVVIDVNKDLYRSIMCYEWELMSRWQI